MTDSLTDWLTNNITTYRAAFAAINWEEECQNWLTKTRNRASFLITVPPCRNGLASWYSCLVVWTVHITMWVIMSSCRPAPAPASTCIRQRTPATLLHLQSVIRRPALLTWNEQMFVNIVHRLKTSWYQWMVTYTTNISGLVLVNALVWSLMIRILISKHATREAPLKLY